MIKQQLLLLIAKKQKYGIKIIANVQNNKYQMVYISAVVIHLKKWIIRQENKLSMS